MFHDKNVIAKITDEKQKDEFLPAFSNPVAILGNISV
jgi:hypothetical protein